MCSTPRSSIFSNITEMVVRVPSIAYSRTCPRARTYIAQIPFILPVTTYIYISHWYPLSMSIIPMSGTNAVKRVSPIIATFIPIEKTWFFLAIFLSRA